MSDGDRIAELEKKVQEQSNEVLCLRSALADCVRRLAALEAAPRAAAKPTLVASTPAAASGGSKSARVEKSRPSTGTSNGAAAKAELPSPKTTKAPAKPHAEATHAPELSKPVVKREVAKPKPKEGSG
jgi:hypothetical protein